MKPLAHKNMLKRIMIINSKTLLDKNSFEIEYALSQLKSNKALGPDGNLAEVFKERKTQSMPISNILHNQKISP